jgi:hypothetical protein
VDKYQTVRFDSVRYSVPRAWAFAVVTVKGYVDHIEIVAADQVIARHARAYEPGSQVLDPVHYLVTLGRRPAALDHSNVYRHWRLPAEFGELRAALEARHGAGAGVRQYIRVLQLLAEHPVERIAQAIRGSAGLPDLHADRITQHVQRLAGRQAPQADSSCSSNGLMAVQVPLPDLRRFDQLLSPLEGELVHA